MSTQTTNNNKRIAKNTLLSGYLRCMLYESFGVLLQIKFQ